MQRRIDLEGCLNFRDLGGYATADGHRLRWRVLFRSDSLNYLTADDVVQLRDVLDLEHVVDLRSSRELATDGRGLLERESLRFHHRPLFDGEVDERAERPDLSLADRYFLWAEFAKGAIARVLETLAEVSGPTVYHCAAGKDRTGVVSAVLLGLLGVRDEIIVADYAASREGLDAIIDRLLTSEGYREMISALPRNTLHAEPDTMSALLDRIRTRYGSMRGYVRAIGVSEVRVARLEARLLEG